VTTVHPTAVVSPLAELAGSVEVGPYAVVEAGARLHADVVLDAGAVVRGCVTLGARTRVGEHAVLGGASQIRTSGPQFPGRVEIGANVVVREHVTVRCSTGDAPTAVGAGSLLMGSVHVGHDCRIGEGAVIGHGAGLAGHVLVGDHATIGGMAGVHQWVRIGRLAMIGGLAKITRDVLPYSAADGNPACHRQINRVGLVRHGVSDADLRIIRAAFLALRDGRPPARSATVSALLEAWEHPGRRGVLGFGFASGRRGRASRSLR